MISMPLFKKNLKSNYILLLVFMAVLAMYFSIIVRIYNPDAMSLNDIMLQMNLPQQMIDAFGFSVSDSSFSGHIASFFYGFLMLVFPMIVYIIISNKQVASMVDKSSMAYLLSTNNSRKKIIVTQGLFVMFVVFLLVLFVTIFGSIFCLIMFDEYFILSEFIMLNVGVLLLHLAISSICFLSSCIFNDTKNSLLFGAGIPIFFILINMLKDVSDKLDFLKYFTIYTLYDPNAWINSNNIIGSAVFLIVVCLFCNGFAMHYFINKDLHI